MSQVATVWSVVSVWLQTWCEPPATGGAGGPGPKLDPGHLVTLFTLAGEMGLLHPRCR